MKILKNEMKLILKSIVLNLDKKKKLSTKDIKKIAEAEYGKAILDSYFYSIILSKLREVFGDYIKIEKKEGIKYKVCSLVSDCSICDLLNTLRDAYDEEKSSKGEEVEKQIESQTQKRKELKDGLSTISRRNLETALTIFQEFGRLISIPKFRDELKRRGVSKNLSIKDLNNSLYRLGIKTKITQINRTSYSIDNTELIRVVRHNSMPNETNELSGGQQELKFLKYCILSNAVLFQNSTGRLSTLENLVKMIRENNYIDLTSSRCISIIRDLSSTHPSAIKYIADRRLVDVSDPKLLKDFDPSTIKYSINTRLKMSIEDVKTLLPGLKVEVVSAISETDNIYKIEINYSKYCERLLVALYMRLRPQEVILDSNLVERLEKISQKIKIKLDEFYNPFLELEKV